MSPGATFDRVYLALKEQLGTGRFPPGAHLDPAALSEELNASVTPVRDALHRLIGERIVSAPRGDGFRVPLLTEAGLRDLYGWNSGVLALALRNMAAAGAEIEPATEQDLVARTETLFLKIAASSGSGELHAAVSGLNDRLRSTRRAEGRFLLDLEDELHSLEQAYGRRDLRDLRTQLARYHRRRDKAAPEILATLMPLF